MDFVSYLRAHGNSPSPLQHPLGAGALSGSLAAVPALLIAWNTGVFGALAEHLDVPSAYWAAFDGLWMIGMAIVFARVFGRAVNDARSSWLFGIGYGFVLWVAGPVTVLDWTFDRVLEGTPAIGAFVGFLCYGLVLGVVYPRVHAPMLDRSWKKHGSTPHTDGKEEKTTDARRSHRQRRFSHEAPQ